MAEELLGAAAAPDLDAAFGALDVPVYLRVGELDVAAPPAVSFAIASRARSVTVDVVPGAGHLLGHEDTAGTALAIEAWAARLP